MSMWNYVATEKIVQKQNKYQTRSGEAEVWEEWWALKRVTLQHLSKLLRSQRSKRMLKRVRKPPFHTRELRVAIRYQPVRFEMKKVTSSNYGKTALKVVKLWFPPQPPESSFSAAIHLSTSLFSFVLSEFTAVLGVVSQCLITKIDSLLKEKHYVQILYYIIKHDIIRATSMYKQNEKKSLRSIDMNPCK